MTDADIIAESQARWTEAEEADRENRLRAIADARFEADTGDGAWLGTDDGVWPRGVKRQREREGRICLTINKSRTITRQVANELRLQPPAISVSPAEDGDVQVAAVIEGLVRSIEQSSRAKRIYAKAGEDAARGNMGFWRVTTDYVSDDSFDQEIRIKPILNPLSVVYDPASQDSTRRDARYCFVYEDMPRSEFEARFKGKADIGFYSDGADTFAREWVTTDTIRIAEYWCVKETKKKLYQLLNGETRWEDDQRPVPPGVEWVTNPDGSPRTRVAARKSIVMYLVSGVEVLEKSEWPGDRIPIIPVWGEEARVGDRRVRNGVLTYARDAIRLHTFARSANAETVASQPKAPWLVTPKMVSGYEEMWKQAANGNPAVLYYNPDGSAPSGGPTRQQPPTSSQGWVQEAMQSADDIKSTTGIFDASLGARSNETSGKAITARQREGDVGTYVFIDNVLDAIEETGRVIINLIPKIYDAPRQVRILGKKMEATIVRINQAGGINFGVGKYDVAVSTGPSVTTQRQETAELLTSALQAAPMLAPVILPRLAGVIELPDADEFAAEVKQLLQPQPGPQGPPPPNPKDIASARKDMASANLDDVKADELRLSNMVTAGQLGLSPMGFASQPPEPDMGENPGAPGAFQGQPA
jgi:hypothetical protein